MKPTSVVPENLWRVVSRGYAAENLKIDDVYLEVYCPELIGFADGEIVSDKVLLVTSGEDDRGNQYTCQVLTANAIKAKWRQQGTNRITAPCVRRGERIEVWQYADADQYYWSTSGEDDWLRRLETVTWAFSNTQDEDTKEMTPENTYWGQVNTHEKVVNFSTSKSDGEPFEHHIQIDTKKGNFHYRDDVGNYIQVESGSNRITVENAAGARVVLDGINGDFDIPGNFNLNVGGALSINAGSTKVNGPMQMAGGAKIENGLETSGNLTNNGKDVGGGHAHKNVKTGSDQSGGPV